MANSSLPEDRRAPAFSFYPNDFTSGTRTFSLAEVGAYMRLLCHQWDAGSVPDDAVERGRIFACSQREADKLWARILVKFDQCEDGLWRNARLEAERAKQAERRAKLAANGNKGGRPAGKPNGNQKDNQTETNRFTETDQADQVSENQMQSLSFPSSSSSSISSSERERDAPTEADTLSRRAGEFCQWYESTHQRLIGVGYIGTRSDYERALALVAKFTDAELRDAALVWFGQDDSFATTGTRSIPKFASRASDCVLQARSVA